MPTPAETNRDRILAGIDKILADAYKAPEQQRSALYAFMLDEFARCSQAAEEYLSPALRQALRREQA